MTPRFLSARSVTQSTARGFAAVMVSAEPCVSFLPDGRNVKVYDHPIQFEDSTGKIWEAPVGTETDGASIPQVFWTMIGGPFEGKYRDAAILHDYAYQGAPANESGDEAASKSPCRAAADAMLREAAIACGTGKFKAGLIYHFVRLGGGVPWAKHARANAAKGTEKTKI